MRQPRNDSALAPLGVLARMNSYLWIMTLMVGQSVYMMFLATRSSPENPIIMVFAFYCLFIAILAQRLAQSNLKESDLD